MRFPKKETKKKNKQLRELERYWMEIDTNRLTPGMVIEQDIIGKSGRPIVPKNTKLTEVHIEFIKNFLIDKVSVSSTVSLEIEPSPNKAKIIEQKEQTLDTFENEVSQYKRHFSTWKNNLPIEMYDIRKTFLPLFERVVKQPFHKIASITENRPIKELFYYKSVAMSLLSVFLAIKLNYERKYCLPIGFATLLCDSDMVKLNTSFLKKSMESDPNYQMHPLYSYKMVENITTLTKQAKIAILQHHERLDGSGYPAKGVGEKIIPFARIIAVSDFYYSNNTENVDEMIQLLTNQIGKLDEEIVQLLIYELKEMQQL